MCDKDAVYIVKRLKVLHTEIEDILNMAIKELERIERTERGESDA